MIQESLFRSEPEAATYPGEPAVWLQRVVIVSARHIGVEPIRNIEFRRGLNVINARLTQDVDTAAFGHNVGKTLLVRMIRYALGDKQYAGARVRRRIKEELPKAWLLAQIRVNRKTWGIARSLARPRDSFCVQTDQWQDLLAHASDLRPFSEFATALETLVPSEFSSVRLAHDHRQPTWTDLLGWLIRDQHCRYTNHNAWRSKEDDSEQEILVDSDANMITRVVMKLFDRVEYECSVKLDGLRHELRQIRDQLQQIGEDQKQTAQRISEDAGISEDLTQGDLPRAAIREMIEVQRQNYESDLARLPEATLQEDADSDLVERRSECDNCKGQIDQLKKNLVLEKERLTLAQKPAEIESLAQHRKELSCGLEGCHFLTATSFPPDPNRQDRIDEYQANVDRINNEIAMAIAESDQKLAALREAEQVARSAKQNFEQVAAGVRQNIARCDLLLRQLDVLVRLASQRDDLESQVRTKEALITELENQREARAYTRRDPMKRLNEIFGEVTNALIRRSMGKPSRTANRILQAVVNSLSDNPIHPRGLNHGRARQSRWRQRTVLATHSSSMAAQWTQRPCLLR